MNKQGNTTGKWKLWVKMEILQMKRTVIKSTHF